MLNNPQIVSMELNGAKFSIETGRVAKQSDGSALVSHGETMALVTAVASKRPADRDFLPLFVERNRGRILNVSSTASFTVATAVAESASSETETPAYLPTGTAVAASA